MTRESPRTARVAFGLAIGTSAFTLFLVEPLMGKALLPIMGGGASVWLVSLVFFQTALLLGYFGAFLLGRVKLEWQLIAQPIAICVVGALSFPFTIARSFSVGVPEVATLWLLIRAIGAPFVVLAANASLLQSWADKVKTPAATSTRDVYGLYSSSNLGSMLALFLFPLALEPFIGLRALMLLWSISYLATSVLVAIAARSTWKSLKRQVQPLQTSSSAVPEARLPAKTWVRWCAYAFLPSALLSAFTNVLVSDVGSIPLLWTIPLGIYLLTFVLAFRERAPFDGVLRRYFPFVSVLTCVVLVPWTTLFSWWTAVALFAFLFVGGYLAHRRLWDLRPPPRQLAVFYLFVSLGGALGGAFVGLLAPHLFRFNAEFPLLFFAMVVVGARSHAEGAANGPSPRRSRLWLDLALAASTTAIMYGALHLPSKAPLIACLGALSLVIYASRAAPLRFSLCLLGLMAPARWLTVDGSVLLRTRNYYGTLVVSEDGETRRLGHGATLHGIVDLAHPEEPWTYYARAGAVGAAFQKMQSRSPTSLSYGFVGLGVGTMLTYVRSGEPVTVFEIDPDIIAIAESPRLFPFVTEARARTKVDIRLGDARRLLAEVPDASYDLLALDAFSSDAIPVHLLTREAFVLYRAKLRAGGVLLVHISNRYFALDGMVARLAKEIGASAFLGTQPAVGRQSAAQWVWIGEDPPPDFTPIVPSTELWTDDFSSPIRLLR